MAVFERVLCGVDGSAESLEAVRQSDLLVEPGGRLLLVAVVDASRAIHFRLAPTAVHAARRALEDVEELDRAAAEALERARREATRAADVETLETGGSPADGLLEAAAASGATLVAVGSHGLGRAAGVLLGSVATRVLRRAPCSVLVARPSRRGAGAWAPRTVVVGVDGTTGSDAALGAARELEARHGATVTTLEVEGRRTAHALVDASREADLLVVGSRRGGSRHPRRSVSEHAAHDARCSVLVVRGDDARRPR